MYTQSTLRTLAPSLFVAALLLAVSGPALAHCDTMDGPVVADARAALADGDLSPVLKWVAAEDEQQIRAAFENTLVVRALNEQARELADRWFFETLVRLHRASEGAPFTGLKPAGSVENEAILMADRTLAEGSVDELAGRIAEHAARAVREWFETVTALAAAKDRSPEDGREWVAAYVDYIHFVKQLAGVVHGRHTPADSAE